MHGPDAGLQPGQPPADVHQARAVARGAVLGAGRQHVAHLVGQHRRSTHQHSSPQTSRRTRNTPRRRPADQIDSRHIAQQRSAAGRPPATTEANGRSGDKSPDVENMRRHLPPVERRLAARTTHRSSRRAPRRAARGPRRQAPGDHRMLVPDRRRARTGRHHDHVVVAERVDEVADQRQRLALVAGIDVHLPAAGLGAEEVDPWPSRSSSRTVAFPACGTTCQRDRSRTARSALAKAPLRRLVQSRREAAESRTPGPRRGGSSSNRGSPARVRR